MRSERWYMMEKVSNGWILYGDHSPTFVCDTLGEAMDQLDAEEKKFPIDE